MNTLDFLRQKADQLGVRIPKSGIMAVVRHIEMAERHFVNARENSDSDFFTDVIYRANQAFEGILKESYKILAEKDPTKKSPYEIENYLADNDTFQSRVMELFTNYRTQWRNPSTHDHLITFTESEAFLSVLSVTAFAGILMDQIIEKVTFDQEKDRLRGMEDSFKGILKDYRDEPLIDRITYLLQSAGDQLFSSQSFPSEVEFAGALRAFMSTVLPEITVNQEPLLKDNIGTLRPDFIFDDGKERIVLEIKRYRKWNQKTHQHAFDQIKRYLDSSKLTHGILLLYPAKDAEKTDEKYDKIAVENLDSEGFIVTIRFLPRSMQDNDNCLTNHST